MEDTGEGRAGGGLAQVLTWPLRILRKLIGVVPAAVQEYFAHRCPQFAAGIAYRVLFSLAPLAIVIVSIFGLVLQDDEIRTDVTQYVVDLLPFSEQGSQNVADAITNIATPASAVGLLSLVVFVFAASGMMASLRLGLEAAMGVERARPIVRSKLVDVALVVLTAVLVLVMVTLNVVAQTVTEAVDWISDQIGVGAGWTHPLTRQLLPLLVSTVVVMLLYRFVPARRLRFREAVAGGLVTAVLLLGIALASGWILRRTTELSVIYGSLTAALVFLYSVYLYASALLFGAAVASAWAAPPGPSEPIGAQLKRGAKGLFVHQPEPETGQERPPAATASSTSEDNAAGSPAADSSSAGPSR